MLPQHQQVERGGGPQETPPWLAMGPNLERNLWFLQRQHAETLQQLHAEIELLKRKNRDLHYQLIMHPELQKKDSSSSEVPQKSSTKEDIAAKLLPRRGSHIKTSGSGSGVKITTTPAPQAAARQSSVETAGHQQQPEIVLIVERGEDFPDFWRTEEHLVMGKVAKVEDLSAGPEVSSVPKGAKGPSSVQEAVAAEAAHPRAKEFCDRASSPIGFASPTRSTSREFHLPAASSNPFLVNVLPSHMRKPPTLEECEVVIRQLWNINHLQMQELTYLRSCLEDIQRTKRIPEDYRLAGQLGQDCRRFPSMKNIPRRWILNPLPAAERAVLPALKQTLGNAFAERQKRTQAVQRSRLQRTAR